MRMRYQVVCMRYQHHLCYTDELVSHPYEMIIVVIRKTLSLSLRHGTFQGWRSIPDNKVYGPHAGPMNLAIRDLIGSGPAQTWASNSNNKNLTIF